MKKCSISRVALAIATLVPVVQAQPVRAEPVAMSAELKAFLTRPDEQKTYGAVMSREWQNAVDNCPSPTTRALNVAVDVPPKVDAHGTPVSGQWRVVANLEGCGKTRTLSVIYGFGHDGKMVRAALLPGTTMADPRLQLDSLMYATIGMAKLAPKDCKETRISDTRFVAFEGSSAPPARESSKRAWTEEWTVRSCGVTGLVTMHFRPDATGTNISTKPAETRKIDP